MTGMSVPRMVGRSMALGLISILALAACGSSSGVAASDVNGSWTLTSITGADGRQVTVPGAITPGITFQDGKVNGDTGCNTFSGEVTLDGSTLKLGPLATTRKACTDEVNAVETAYLTALGAVNQVAIDGDTLTLSTSGGNPTLTFSRA